MILARISRAIREQNWLAVAIEFVIVVAGVLLAFQVTAWTTARADRTNEYNALVAFTAELDAIRSEALRAQDMATAKLHAASTLLSVQPDALSDDEIDPILSDLLWHQDGTLETGLLESLLASPALSLPDAPELRANLSRWPDLVNRFLSEQSRDTAFYNERYAPFLLEHAELERIGTALRPLAGTFNAPTGYTAPLGTPPPASISHAELIFDPQFRGLLVYGLWDQVDIINEAERLAAAAEATQARIAARLTENHRS